VKNKWAYLERLKAAIEQKHKCSCFYRRTQLVNEKLRGESIWLGEVEVFELTNHKKTDRCYAWSHRDGRDKGDDRFVTVMGLGPVTSPQAAVRASLGLSDGKRADR